MFFIRSSLSTNLRWNLFVPSFFTFMYPAIFALTGASFLFRNSPVFGSGSTYCKKLKQNLNYACFGFGVVFFVYCQYLLKLLCQCFTMTVKIFRQWWYRWCCCGRSRSWRLRKQNKKKILDFIPNKKSFATWQRIIIAFWNSDFAPENQYFVMLGVASLSSLAAKMIEKIIRNEIWWHWKKIASYIDIQTIVVQNDLSRHWYSFCWCTGLQRMEMLHALYVSLEVWIFNENETWLL